ncbi:MAG: hypothetical protein RR877_10475 [Aurantimicrobium sp.]|uniref:hypothetical protein n=1 Tax=Aurantimicrobium sp. TaxID=1930784 RepID=UPI002FC95450
MAKKPFSFIKEWCSEQQFNVAEKSAKIAREVFLQLSANSPVRTGRYEANWHIGTSVVGKIQTEQKDPSKSVTDSMIKSFISDDYFLRNNSVVMYNTADYHINVEDIGWPRTDPYAPIRNTLSWAMNKFV